VSTKFFEVLQKYHAPADWVSSKVDYTNRTMAYFMSMVQVHWEMKNIHAHNFQGHPAVAPVVTLHVFKSESQTLLLTSCLRP
jgi:hypothetical protein